jgi:hypothetical protein
MDYKVTPYTNKIFASDILSYLNVDSTGDVVSVEVWNTLWNSMFDFASNVNEHMQELLAEDTGLIPRLIDEHAIMLSEHAQILQEHEVLKKQFAVITEAIARVEQQAADVDLKHKEVVNIAEALSKGLIHTGPDAPTNPNIRMWIRPSDDAQSVVGVGDHTIDGGEIFNDYNTNKALSAFATAKGSNNIAGGKCFKVIADPIDNGDGTGVYTLDSVEGLEIGMRYSTFLQTQSVDAGKITAIDTNTKTITVNGFVYYPLNEYADDPENLSITNSLLITGRPDLGTTDIGFTAFIGGKGNFAQNTHTLAFGEGNYVLGKYGTALGIKNVAAYNSFVAGQDNRNLGATSFIVGANNIATANRDFVTGQSNKVTAPNSFVGGQNTTINGTNSLGYGSWNTVDGNNAGCFGNSNQVKGKNSFAAGLSLMALQDNQCVIGVKNSYNGSSDALFIIGNGSDVKGCSNAFTVHKDGHAEVQTMGSTDKSVATKKYVDQELATFDFIKVVDELPVEGLPNKIYLVPSKTTTEQDLFDEYIWINKGAEDAPEFGWEFIASKVVEVDLTNYVTQPTLATALDNVNTELDAMRNTLEALGVDYIVEHGASGIWTWEKWNSGKYVCFGNIDMSANAGTTDVFDGTASYKNVTFPFLFTELPIVNLTNNSTSDKESYGLVTCSVRNATTSGFAAQQNARGGLDMYISAYVIGKWK